MAQGYTIHLLRSNQQADDRNIGVRLGRICIAKDISVAEVADAFGVTRATVYNWFGGTVTPMEETVPLIENYIAELE